MTEQQNDENKPQDSESGSLSDSWGDVLENELANDNVDETGAIADMPADEAGSLNEQPDQDDSGNPADESDDASNLDLPLGDQAESGAYDLSDLSGDEVDLIEDIIEEETDSLNEQSEQDISDQDLPLDAQAESEAYDLSDLYDTENDPAQMTAWQDETKPEELPDFDLPMGESKETEEDGVADTAENDLAETEEDDLTDTVENDLEYIFEEQDATAESSEPEVATNPPDDTSSYDIPPVAAAATAMLSSSDMKESQQPLNNNSNMLAVGLGLTGTLLAAAAIWLNMGLSDQLARLKAQQQPQNAVTITTLSQKNQEFALKFEELQLQQDKQAEAQLSSLESMQQQLDALTAVVATRVAKQWQASSKASPATEKPVAIADETTTTPPKPESPVAEETKMPADSPDHPLEQLVVSASIGNIRSTGSSSGAILHKVKKGTIVSKVSQNNDWIQIQLNNGDVAWGHQSIFKSPASTSKTDLPEPAESAGNIPKPSASNSNEGWAVNLMSLGSEAAAEKQVAHFQGLGIKAEYTLIPANGKTWYRVRIAGFANEQDAIDYKELLSEKHSINSWHNRM